MRDEDEVAQAYALRRARFTLARILVAREEAIDREQATLHEEVAAVVQRLEKRAAVGDAVRPEEIGRLHHKVWALAANRLPGTLEHRYLVPFHIDLDEADRAEVKGVEAFGRHLHAGDLRWSDPGQR